MKFAKKFEKQVHGDGPNLQAELHRRMAGYQEERPHKNIHASDMTNDRKEFCPREYALKDVINQKWKKSSEFIGTALRFTFDLGEALHDLFRENWAADMAIGTWECLACKRKYEFSKRPDGCPNCNNHAFRYHEERFKSEYSGISGSMDVIVDVGQPKVRIVELKSIKADDFKKLLAPLAEHRLRTNLYLRLIAESNHWMAGAIDQKTAYICYMVKGFGVKDDDFSEVLGELGIRDAKFTPFKVFEINRDDKATQEISDRARPLHLFRCGEAGMPKGICPNSFGQRASMCPMIKHCWSGSYPPGVMMTTTDKEKEHG